MIPFEVDWSVEFKVAVDVYQRLPKESTIPCVVEVSAVLNPDVETYPIDPSPRTVDVNWVDET